MASALLFEAGPKLRANGLSAESCDVERQTFVAQFLPKSAAVATSSTVSQQNPERLWSSVMRVSATGELRFDTELLRSTNPEDVGTKGKSSTGRLAYVPATDSLVAYFAHQQRYDDGVRHQGGYLAIVDASGVQDLISGWSKANRTHRSALPKETIELIRRMARENRLWGAERIRGELLKLGIRVSKRTVQKG